jgi:IMP cyclohydrolase
MKEAPRSYNEQMMAANMENLRQNPYPGRGIIQGINKQGNLAVQAYWVMGRSENSRNRILALRGDIVKTEAFDASKVKDPSLIIYTAMREVNGIHIVSNGDQTDSVAEEIKNGGTFKSGLEKRMYEPDAPNFTPRVSGMFVAIPKEGYSFSLSIIRKEPNSENPIRVLSNYLPKAGVGECIHTYKGDGNPLPAFDSDRSYPVPLDGSVEEIAKIYWNLLNHENRVALAVKGINLKNGMVDYSIINQLQK